MNITERALRSISTDLRKQSAQENLEWAQAVLDTFGGPGGARRYNTKEEAKEIRKLYMRAYQTVYAKGKESRPDSAVKRETRKIRRRRPSDVSQFYISILSAESIKCCYCLRDLKTYEREADHYIPLSRGGEHAASNMVVCCRSCNSKKGDLMPNEFML